MPNGQLNLAEYFAGIGLVRMALAPCGWQVVWANDISLKKYEMYSTFFPGAASHYVVGDIFEIQPRTIPSTTLATCSFPCIDLSLAGNMNGMNGKHSSAFWGFIKALKEQGNSAPPIILVENVPGWLHSNNGADFRVTIEALNALGYACDVFTLDAVRFTPQSRCRVFLIGTRFRIISDWRLLLSRPRSLLSDRLRKTILANIDLGWFYNDMPSPPEGRKGGLSEVVEDLSDSDDRWWSDQEVNRHLRMMDESHYKRVVQLAEAKAPSYRTFFRRRRNGLQRAEVRSDDLAGCLRTAVGGSGKQFLIKADKGRIRMRAMTPREYARLQGVPDDYEITVSEVQALTGFGDAVCVPVLRWIAENGLSPLVKQCQLEPISGTA